VTFREYRMWTVNARGESGERRSAGFDREPDDRACWAPFWQHDGPDRVAGRRRDDHERRRDGRRRRREADDQIIEIGVVGEPTRAVSVDRHRVGNRQNPHPQREAKDNEKPCSHRTGAYAGGRIKSRL
jgi:hypothetical protein